ncbi:uncharacterized protein LOC133925778 [Phragmites australis]|uniref:uncharacterized protein LOC133925778 n=1 Tax=Phragmites australis TaxID=29695 RepID=UPI002D7A0788|nr:uncharacterized protein LOC133925778 [Phragmites australis]
MAAPATSVVFLEAEARKLASHPLRVREVPGGVKDDDHEEEMRRRRRCLLERFMTSFGPGCQCVYETKKAISQSHPCVLYTMKVSVKKARVSWSHRSSRRFVPERRGPAFPIPLCRAVEHDQVEQVVHKSGEVSEPDRPGILSGIHEAGYYLLELDRERDVIHKEGSSAPWKEVAVIRGLPGGCGITVTSHVEHLVVRLHDMLFRLPGPDGTVDLRFSENWFCLPAGWTEERLYAEDGLHFVDIAAPVETLVKKLYAMRQQEEKEMERRRWETEEQRERRLQEEEAMRKLEEEERRKIHERKEERRREEAVAKRPVRTPLGWDAALWEISEVQPAAVHCYSKFKLSMNSNKQVSCKCVGQEGLQDMLRRVDDGEFILPIFKAAPASASSKALETLGFVEGYCDLRSWGFGPTRGRFMDKSGRTRSSVLMVSQSEAKVLTIKVLVDKLDILLDDGKVMTGLFGVSVDVHCDDISSSELLTTNWAYHILCKNTDGEGITFFSTLLVQLKKNLQLQLTKEESRIYSISAVDAEGGSEDLAEQWQKQQERVPAKPKQELVEVELQDCSLLFPTLQESEV